MIVQKYVYYYTLLSTLCIFRHSCQHLHIKLFMTLTIMATGRQTPNPHSVIASDVEMCRSTLPQLCPNLLNRARVSEPEARHKTLSIG